MTNPLSSIPLREQREVNIQQNTITMGRIKGIPNKVTTQVKQKLEELIDEIVNSIDIDVLDTNQKIKMLQISLQYCLPRLQASTMNKVVEDVPLFIED